MVSFNFNSKTTLEGLEKVYPCLQAWSTKTSALKCEKAGIDGFITVTYIDSKDEKSKTAKINSVAAKHMYKWINEFNSLGGIEISKHYTLKLIGKEENGSPFILKAYLGYETEDGGRTWDEGLISINIEGKKEKTESKEIVEKKEKSTIEK